MATELFRRILEEYRKDTEKEKNKVREKHKAFSCYSLWTPNMRSTQQFVQNRLAAQRQHPAAPGPCHSSRSVQMRNPIAWG